MAALSIALLAIGLTPPPQVPSLPPPPALAGSPPQACTVEPLRLDIERIRHAKEVQAVQADPDMLHATILLTDGDVLKATSLGCSARAIEVRLWTKAGMYVDPPLLQKAAFVTGLLLPSDKALPLQRAMAQAKFDSPYGKVRHISHERSYLIHITSEPLNGWGYSMMDIALLNL